MKVQSLAENVALKLEELITIGTYQEEDRLPEIKLAKQFEVSRSTIREALLLLERRHLIQINPNCGAVVSTITPTDVFFLGKMAKVLLACVIEDVTRRPWTISQETVFKNILNATNEAGQNQETLKVYSNIFEFIYEGLKFSEQQGNHYLIQMLENILPCLRRDLYKSFQLNPNQTLDKTIDATNKMFEYALMRNTIACQEHLFELIDHLMDILTSALIARQHETKQKGA